MSTNALPRQSVDFPGWYGEVVRRAGLAENAAVRGAMVIKPYGCGRVRASGFRAPSRRTQAY
jgi:prolyl-tRNA synthetase